MLRILKYFVISGVIMILLNHDALAICPRKAHGWTDADREMIKKKHGKQEEEKDNNTEVKPDDKTKEKAPEPPKDIKTPDGKKLLPDINANPDTQQPDLGKESKPSDSSEQSTEEGISPAGRNASRPPLSEGLQPRLQSIRTEANAEGQVVSLAGVVEPWEVWWTLNREQFLDFRQPIEWVTVKESEGSRSVIRHKIYDDLFNILVKSLEERDMTVAWNAAIALGRSGRAEAVKPLKKAYGNTPYILVKNYALISLGWLKDISSLDILTEVLLDKKMPEISRSHSAVALGYINDPVSIKALKDIVTDSDYRKQSDVVCAAMFSLGLLKDESSAKLLSGYLNSEKRLESRLRVYAALGLGHIGTDDAFAELKKCLVDKDKDVRVSAAMALGLVGQPKAKDELIIMLKDKDETVRGMAAVSLAQSIRQYPSKSVFAKSAADALLAALANSKREAQGLMILALGILGEPRLKPELKKIIEDRKKTDMLKGAAVIAYGLLKDKDAVPMLSEMLAKRPEDPVLAPYIILALGMIGQEKGVEAILPLWQAVDKNIGSVAYSNMAVALAMLGKRREVIDQLVKQSGPGQNNILRQYALYTLGLLADRQAAQSLVDACNESSNNNIKSYAVAGIGLLMENNRTPLITQWTAGNNTEVFTWIIDHLLPIPSW
ncbi:MAG: HEAT repeat domain-containing protein [Candidatus Brocadiia bacterium]